MVNAALVPVNTRSEGASRSLVRPAAYFVPGNDHLVHLVRNPCYSLPLRFSVASYSVIKKTTGRQRDYSTLCPGMSPYFLFIHPSLPSPRCIFSKLLLCSLYQSQWVLP